MRVRLLLVSLVLVAVGATAAAFAWPRAGDGSPVIFSTIPASKLALAGITLAEPDGPTPPPSAGTAAAAAASDQSGGRKVLEYHYAHCLDSQSVHLHIDEDCWAVSLDPTGLGSNGPPGSTFQKATYNLVLIDPANDKFIEGADGG